MTVTRYNTPTTAIPCAYLYQESVTTFGDSCTNHTWDIIEFKTQHFSYTAGDDKITLAKVRGYFEIIFQCSFTQQFEGDINIRSRIKKNGTVISGADCYTLVRPSDNANNNIHIIIYLEPGDYIQVCSETDTNQVSNVTDTCRLIIKFIPMAGWNNSSGGQLDYKGGVMR